MVYGGLLEEPRKIVIRATNWIGDAVLSLPALEALRARLPEAEIVLVAKPWVFDIYQHHAAVNRQIIYEPQGKHRGVSGFASLVRQLREERFDTAILFQNAFQAAWMVWRAGIPVRIGYDRDGRARLLTTAIEPPSPAVCGHQAYYYLQLLFRAGIISRPEPPGSLDEIHLTVQPDEKNWAVRKLESLGLHGPRFLIGIVPGASFGPAKRWPAGRFAELADRLIAALNADVLILGSEAERGLANDVAREMEHTPVAVAGDTTLRQAMALLERCRLVVTNDSGPMHVASALALPVVAIFGSTDAAATGPLGPYSRVVQNPVACAPCGLHLCPIDFRCMEGLSVASVYRAALELVKQLGVTHDNPARPRQKTSI
ncbi:MAG: lipopolysaccharide heptosyltransferase II [Terriglobia bacterium]